MKRFMWLWLSLASLALVAFSSSAQPPEKRSPGQGQGQAGRRPGGPPGFELGRVLPPFIREELQLTPDQERQIADLESQVKDKLNKILTDEQKKQMKNTRPRGPGGPPGGPGEGGDGPPRGNRKEGGGPPPDKNGPPPDKEDAEHAHASVSMPHAGIQWFATWESGLAEAKATGRPILLVSAAPHCAGVPGIW